MNALVNTENLLMWVRDGRVVTVDVRKEGQGYVAEWWISGNFEGDLHVMGVMKFPIYGDSEDDARQRAGFLLDDVLYIGQVFYGGDGLVGSITPDRS